MKKINSGKTFLDTMDDDFKISEEAASHFEDDGMYYEDEYDLMDSQPEKEKKDSGHYAASDDAADESKFVAEGKKPPKSQSRKALERLPKHVLIWRMAKPFVSVFIGIAIVCAGVFFAWNYVVDNYISPVDVNDKTTKEVTIKSGTNLTKLSEQLEDEGIIRNATIFKYYVDFTDSASSLIAGQYQLSPSMTFDDIIDMLKRPREATTVKMLTFTEGMDVEDMGNVVVKEGILKNSKEFLSLAKSGEHYKDYFFIKEVLESADLSEREYVLEGYLSPNTYEVFTTSTEDMIITKLLDQFGKVFNETYQARASELGMTTDEVVTLASIIEKEAKTKDFSKVSAVFHNRLKEDIALGSCATHQYFMHERKLVWSKDELAIDSPYNTYINKGLPPGPICNPSEAAIKAALYPDEAYLEEGYLYFCLGDPKTGETVFAKTLKEHEANQAKYLKLWQQADAEMEKGNG